MGKQEEEEELPIVQYRDKILKQIQNNPVTIITGETGCGKTTKVPQFILEDARSRNQPLNVLVSQPRKIAAISIARRVSSELKTKVGGLVGYQVGLDKKLNKMDKDDGGERTQILFCTTGVVLQKLIRVQSMEKYTHLILDEIHERGIDTDLLMTILREFLFDKMSDTRIILMSATLNAAKFQKYFSIKIDGKILEPPIVEMEIQRPYKIDITYLDDLVTEENEKDVIEYKRNVMITTDMLQLVAKIIADHLEESEKSILVFLPGVFEIECMHTVLKRKEELNEKCLVTILHAQLPASEQRQVFIRSTLPKVILATNIAESSITLPDVGCVIDLCIAKFMCIEKDSTMASLKLDRISKHSCQQRAGRTGRVCDGKVYRMVHKKFYEENISDETEPEIKRAPLETTILRIKMFERVGESPISLLNKCMDSPNTEAIVNSILILKETGGLHATDLDGQFIFTDGDLTYQGRVMATIPIDVRLSKLIIMGYLFNVLDDAIIIAAGLSIKSIFQNRYNKKMEDYKMKLKMAKGSACDALTMMNAYKLWLNKAQGGEFRDWESEEKWCNENILERKNLHEMRQLINEIKNRLVDLKVEAIEMNWPPHEVPFILKVCIAAAFYPNYFMLGTTDNYNEREVYKGLLGLDPNRTVYYRKMKPNQIGEVYIEQIKKKLIESKFLENTDGIKITFDSSKIFVELPDTAMIDYENAEDANEIILPGKILPKIYEGVKLRKLNLARESMNRPRFHQNNLISSFKLKVMNYNNTREYAVERGAASVSYGRVKLLKPRYEYPQYCVFPQYASKEMNGRVTHVDHCGNFFFQVDDEKNWLYRIQQHFTCCDLKHGRIIKNSIAIIYHEDLFNRGKIVKIYEDKTADCYFFDYGYTRKIDFENIFEVEDEDIKIVFGIPERGFHCKLSRIEPSFANCPRGKWTTDAIKCFEEAVLDYDAKIEIYSFVNDIASVELFVDDCNVNDYLVYVKYAVRCEEPYVNRLNYNEREALQCSSMPSRDVEFSERENKMINFEIPHPDERLCTETILIEGPFSPLETSICGIAENSRGMAKVDQFSVNSVQLDTCVENHEGQLLVAADVVKNPPNEPTLHAVTAMPNIRGLPALLMMMFAPKTIFECDKKFERILYVKSNIGYDEIDEPFFANHECTAPVNFQLDAEDYNSINELRFVMSCLLKVERTEKIPELSASEKQNLMQRGKDLMMKILQRDRKEIKCADNRQEGFVVGEKNLILKKQSRFFVFNQVEFPKLIEN